MHAFSWIVALLLRSPTLLHAQVFQGGGLQEGIQEAQNIQGVSQMDLPTTITSVITSAIDVLGLLAVVSIIICGVMFILSLGNEDTVGKAKKGIIYSVVGLIIILFTKAIVTFITNLG